MVDTRRWILVETWLSLGLRVEWAPSYRKVDRDQWMRDDEMNLEYIYAGDRVWLVHDASAGRRMPGVPHPTAPAFGVETLRHELGHYLVATSEQRTQENFGLKPTGFDDQDTESRAMEAERIIDAMLGASARIADLALRGRP